MAPSTLPCSPALGPPLQPAGIRPSRLRSRDPLSPDSSPHAPVSSGRVSLLREAPHGIPQPRGCLTHSSPSPRPSCWGWAEARRTGGWGALPALGAWGVRGSGSTQPSGLGRRLLSVGGLRVSHPSGTNAGSRHSVRLYFLRGGKVCPTKGIVPPVASSGWAWAALRLMRFGGSRPNCSPLRPGVAWRLGTWVGCSCQLWGDAGVPMRQRVTQEPGSVVLGLK